jgi:hypothetical protein
MLASSNISASPVVSTVRQSALDRCVKEQEEILGRLDVIGGKVPAWLVTLGLEDWEMEKRFIVEKSQLDQAGAQSEAKP